MRKQQNGFTLIEIAIVLVIIGLLLGGVLKGQELITSARVRNIAASMDGVKIAYLGFQDRFRSLPGDYSDTLASANIPGPTVTKGCTVANATCQNGRIDNTNEFESMLAWHQLSRAGFVNGSYGCGDPPGACALATVAIPQNSPTNAFSGFLQIVNDNQYSDAAAVAARPAVLNIKTGGNVPAAIVAELDRKIDDGLPLTGSFRSSSGGTIAVATPWDNTTATCVPAAAYDATANPKTCGGVSMQ